MGREIDVERRIKVIFINERQVSAERSGIVLRQNHRLIGKYMKKCLMRIRRR